MKVARLLGLAVASADWLFELVDDRITFSVGASVSVTGRAEAALLNADWRVLFEPADAAVASSAASALQPGERRGPITLTLAPVSKLGRRTATLSMTRLPQLGAAVSCSLTLGPAQSPGVAPSPEGLANGAQFDAMAAGVLQAARAEGAELDLTLVEVQTPATPTETAEALTPILRAESWRGLGAAQLGDGLFGVLHARGRSPAQLAANVTRAAERAGLSVLAQAAVVSLDVESPGETSLRALRFVIDDFLREGIGSDEARLARAFEHRAAETAARAAAFSARVQREAFNLAFQPIVSLRTGAAAHYEVLARFDGDASPYETIRLAEEFDLIQDFDMTMTRAAIERLCVEPSARLAVNLSGRSIMTDAFLASLRPLLVNLPVESSRLLFEVTESAALSELDSADARIQAIRRCGVNVSLDDFGAGAAGFQYLRALSVDGIKIDGGFVRDMAGSPRDIALIRHLAALCRDLGIVTVAEMVETPEIEAALKAVGVDYAQGWLYGRPQSYIPAKRLLARVA